MSRDGWYADRSGGLEERKKRNGTGLFIDISQGLAPLFGLHGNGAKRYGKVPYLMRYITIWEIVDRPEDRYLSRAIIVAQLMPARELEVYKH